MHFILMHWNRKFSAYFDAFLAVRFAIVLYAFSADGQAYFAVDLYNLKSYIDCQTCTAFYV